MTIENKPMPTEAPVITTDFVRVEEAGDVLATLCHGASRKAGWWTDLQTGEPLDARKLVPEKIALCHSELSEALEGHRKGLMDHKLPQFEMLAVELADAIIRIADLAGALDLPLGRALAEKMQFNASLADHKVENRRAAGGKAF